MNLCDLCVFVVNREGKYPMQPHDIGDKNVERLVGASYKPELPEPGFVQQLHARMQAAAQQMAKATPQSSEAARLLKLRRRLGWSMAAAAAVAGVALVLYALDRPEPMRYSLAEDTGPLPVGPKGPRWTGKASEGMVPQPRAAAPAETRVAIGAELTTKAGQRRRVTLADGSVLYLNGDTCVQYVADRQVKLLQGELYVEVSPREADNGATFVVKAPDREVAALGTHFSVWAEGARSGVVVTQGKVHVSGLDGLVHAGQQLTPGAKAVAAAPRVTHLLDWTRELMIAAESPLVPCTEHSGGALIAIDPTGQEMRLSLRKYHVDVHIEDGFARTTIDQTYFNETYGRLEGTFYFPLPADAVLSRLAMYVKDSDACRLMEGGMAERDHARNVYETILHTRRDPALLEWVDGTTFKMRVFPLEPREEKRLLLSYTQKLSSLYGTTRYRFPAGHSMEAVGAWSFAARVKHGAKLHCASDSHPDMKASVDGGDLVLQVSDKIAMLKDDVTLEIHDTTAAAQDAARFSTFSDGQAQYLMLRYRPKMVSQPKQERRDWVFLYEASGSRDPLLARAQIDVIRSLLENAEHNDTFTLLAAGTRLHAFDNKARQATPANVKEAVKFLESVQLIGALDLGQALSALEPTLKSAKNPYLVHVGSGLAAMGERRDEQLVQLIPHGTKYVGVGVGKRWSRAFMKQAADKSGGFFTQINPDEPIRWKAFELLATLNTPRLLAVRVVDNEEKARFLTDVATLSQGEEICAVTRIDLTKSETLPKTIAFTGTLDGEPFVKHLTVEKVADGAGYLPRQWAKLELDRLLAEDSEKHKARIIALSKESYVMTPFTSLLVLETEADYARFNVDRGRKDHWAMYQCPERIAIVYEPNPGQPAGKDAKAKGDPQTVLQSIVVRVPPPVLQYASRGNTPAPAVLNVGQLYNLGAWFITDEEFGAEIGAQRSMPFNRLAQLNEKLVPRTPELTLKVKVGDKDSNSPRAPRLPYTIEALPELGALMIRPDQSLPSPFFPPGDAGEMRRFSGALGGKGGGGFGGGGMGGLGGPGGGFGGSGGRFGPMGEWESSARSNAAGSVGLHYRNGLLGGNSSGSFGTTVGTTSNVMGTQGLGSINITGGSGQTTISKANPFYYYYTSPLSAGFGPNVNLLPQNTVSSGGTSSGTPVAGKGTEAMAGITVRDFNGPVKHDLEVKQRIARLYDQYGLDSQGLEGWMASGQVASLLYDRPGFTADPRLFGDLLLYAPGMNTSLADIDAVLEAETDPDPRAQPGNIDAAARKLIDQARGTGWFQLTVPAEGRQGAFVIHYSGLGQFAWDRVLASGLREQVICNGTTLWHLYPEIGLGSKRPFSRFHRAAFNATVPWLLPPVDDLARGADIKLLDAGTVALVPRGADAYRDEDGKPGQFLQAHLVFGESGRLMERQVVLMPAKTVVYRQRYGAGGTITVEGRDKDKTLATVKLDIALGKAPDLNPKVADLVVVPMPLRTVPHLQATDATGAITKTDVAISLVASHCASQSATEALQIIAQRFGARGDRRIGFYVLLASANSFVNANTPYKWGDDKAYFFNVLVDHPRVPLAYFLAYHFECRAQNQIGLAMELGDIGGPTDGFIQRLGKFRDLYAAWQSGRASQPKNKAGEKVRNATLTFVGRSPLPVYDWALLDVMLRSGIRVDPKLQDDMTLAGKRAGEGEGEGASLALAYGVRYELAMGLWNSGHQDEARKAWRKLYQDTLKTGLLPPIEASFRNALLGPDKSGPAFPELVSEAATMLTKRGRPMQILTLAWQAQQLGNPETANNLVARCVEAAEPGPERALARLQVVHFYMQTGQTVRADTMLKLVLAEEPFTKSPALWRLASQLAAQRSQLARSVACLELALDLEYADLPPVVNLQAIRAEYSQLLMQYQQVANALALLEKEAPTGFVAKVVRAADRWRALEPEPTQVCQMTAKLLQTLGAAELAWDYLTTPLGLRPNEAAPWQGLAQTLQAEGYLDLADKALASAFDAEPTNAQLLWDRAEGLMQASRIEDARAVYRVLAEGNWQPRFQGLQNEAKNRLATR
jgi:ferric-dicitrate binding protein FerR (iron transport regulator)